MKKINLFFLLIMSIIFYNNIIAQHTLFVHRITEKMPEYPGGKEELQKFFINNIIYPKEAQENGIEEVVVVELIINEDGTFSDVKLYGDKKYDLELGKEALRVVNMMPRWLPGQINEKNVRTYYLIPVKFTLDCIFDSFCITKEQNLEKYRLFSTDIFNESTDGISIEKHYSLKLYNSGLYEILLYEICSHKMFYNEKINDFLYSADISNTIISEGSFIEKDGILNLSDKNDYTKLAYQLVYDTIIQLPVYPNKIQVCLNPIQTFSFLSKFRFKGEYIE